MSKHRFFGPAVLTLAVLLGAAPLCGLFSSEAAAQTASVARAYDTSHTIPTNIPGITTFPAPPAGYDAVGGSDEQNAAYGLPPRPDAQSDPASFAKWKQAVGTTRDYGPLRDMGVSSANLQPAGPRVEALSGTTFSTSTSTNWSGVASIVKGLTKFSGGTTGKSFYVIFSDFNVPVAQQAFNGSGGNICDGGYDIEVSWNGIDGFNNGDVLQGGSYSQAYCSGGSPSTYYCGWVEWYPSYNILCKFSVNPGDDMYVETWDTSATNGYVFISDLTKQVSGTYNLTPTTTPYLVGDSAEYIVERPCCVGSNPFPLANYVQNFWEGTNWAYTWDHYNHSPFTRTYPGTATPTNYLITMLNNSGSQDISYPQTSGTTAIFLQDENCANSGGC